MKTVLAFDQTNLTTAAIIRGIDTNKIMYSQEPPRPESRAIQWWMRHI